MRITLLNCSARNRGNTFSLLNLIDDRLDKNIYNSQIISISDYHINYCLGCHGCEKTRKCVQNDDVSKIYNVLKQSDIICIASPSYWGYVTGQLKVFFDRSMPYCNTLDGGTIFPEGKKGIAISIRAGSSKLESQEITNAIKHYYSHLGIGYIYQLSFENIRSPSDLLNDTAIMKINEVASYLNNL